MQLGTARTKPLPPQWLSSPPVFAERMGHLSLETCQVHVEEPDGEEPPVDEWLAAAQADTSVIALISVARELEQLSRTGGASLALGATV
eukprot:5738595-Amphidinium_carterae.1